MTSRFREELAARGGREEDVPDAVRATVATAGRAVFFCGLTVLLGLLGLVLFEFMILRSVGIAGAIVVGLAVSAALTLMPALLAIVGTRIDQFAIRRVAVGAPTDGRWAGLARSVMRRPVAVLIPTLALLLLLGAPFLHVRFNAPDAAILPADVPSRASFDLLRRDSARASSRRSRSRSGRTVRQQAPPTSPSCTTTRDGSRRTSVSAA